MDFRQNSSAAANRPEPVGPSSSVTHDKKVTHGSTLMPTWMTLLNGLALVGIVVLLLAAALALAHGKDNTINEADAVNTAENQAVFLNNGQVYFGKVAAINSRYLKLNNVYYLTQATATGTNGAQSTTGDYTLVKLGCQQIHYPEDAMVISRDQITFWENLNKDGKVAKSISDFKVKYPKGPDCTQTTSQTPATNTPSQATQSSTTKQ